MKPNKLQKHINDLRVSSLTHKIFPIALALMMPIASFYSDGGFILLKGTPLLLNWFLVSFFIYVMWHLLWFASDRTKGKLANWSIAGILVIATSAVVIYQLLIETDEEEWPVALVRLVFAIMIILVIQYAMKSQSRMAQLKLEKEKLQTENYRTQLSSLQAKVDPHFLFNSLNTLRSLIRQQNDQAEPFVMSLSGFFRKSLEYTESPTLPVREELSILKNYLQLMQVRNQEAVSISIDLPKQIQDFQLPTMALQTVVENCFKHNSMSSASPLNILIEYSEDEILVSNNKQPMLEAPEQSGMGLPLLIRRYSLLDVDPGVVVEESNEHYSVRLKLIKP